VSTAEAIALQLEIERCLRNREDALALKLIERLRDANRKASSHAAERRA
jgi:hypothetical protein